MGVRIIINCVDNFYPCFPVTAVTTAIRSIELIYKFQCIIT